VKTLSPREFVQEYAIKSLVCCWSGGRSSLAATHYVLNELEGVGIDKYVVFVDTGVMLPDALSFVKEISAKQGWNLHVLKPKTDFWQYSARYGTPGIKRRWCCKMLKLQPIFDFVRGLKPQRGIVLGFRKDEKRKSRVQTPVVRYMRKISSWYYLPIKNWTKTQVKQYLKENKLPDPPWYRLGLKETCLCSAYGHKKEWLTIKALYPELFHRFVELDMERRKWGRVVWWDKGPVSAEELLKQKTLQEFG
jgi:3'-phosphoadenosine 5'-phosphosulfate sulfotransferase (PAPS reductase)/FAD synthetase